jgi:hypothetical protein
MFDEAYNVFSTKENDLFDDSKSIIYLWRVGWGEFRMNKTCKAIKNSYLYEIFIQRYIH